MAEIYSIGAFRVFRDRRRAEVTSPDWEANHADAVVHAWTQIFLHHGLPYEIAVQKAHERLAFLKQECGQEGVHGAFGKT